MKRLLLLIALAGMSIGLSSVAQAATVINNGDQQYFNSGTSTGTDNPADDHNEPVRPLTIPQETPIPLEGYRWKMRKIKIYLASGNPEIRAGFRHAVRGWNATGAIHFIWTKHRSKAQVIATDGDLTATANQNPAGTTTRQLGTTETSYDPQTHAMLRATSILDSGTLNGTSLAYRTEIAEHELGHALGLAHAQEYQHSVMVPRNVRTGITHEDARSVRLLYNR